MRGDDRLGAAADPSSRCTAKRCIWPSTPRSRARLGRAEGRRCAATATWCGSRPAGRRSSTRCRPGALYKDGSLLVEADARTVADRRRLSFAGVVSVALAVTDKGVLAADPGNRADRHPRERPPTASRWPRSPTTPWSRPSNPCRKPRRRDPDAVAEAVARRGARGDRRALGQEAACATCTCCR